MWVGCVGEVWVRGWGVWSSYVGEVWLCGWGVWVRWCGCVGGGLWRRSLVYYVEGVLLIHLKSLCNFANL